MSILIAAWIFSAFASAWLAKQKGYSTGSWFVLGALFGLFALLAVGLAPKRDVSVTDARQARRDAYWDAKVARDREREGP